MPPKKPATGAKQSEKQSKAPYQPKAKQSKAKQEAQNKATSKAKQNTKLSKRNKMQRESTFVTMKHPNEKLLSPGTISRATLKQVQFA